MADGDCAKDADGASLKDQEIPEVTGRQPKIRRIRNFEEVNRWSHVDHTLQEINEFIRRHIKHIDDRADLKTVPGAHKDRDPRYGLMQHGQTWYTRKGTVTNTTLTCPLVDRCKCLFEVKLVRSPDQTIMYVTDEHSAENHA